MTNHYLFGLGDGSKVLGWVIILGVYGIRGTVGSGGQRDSERVGEE